ncbi:hypothetical protein CLOP_g23265 [Closterium sp. NIES-67]|nr:hypothetical protein CLOP_g23265 [Closterium sp. NIES-67]
MGKREEERRRRRGRKASESSTSYAMQRLLSRNYMAVHADEDILSLYHSSLLYGEVPLTSRMRAVFTSGHVSILIAAAEFVASCVGAVYYLIGTRETMQQKMVWNAGCLAVATFFILVFLLRLYSAPVRWLYVCSYLGVLDILSGIPIFGTGLNSRSAGAMFQVVYFLQMLKPFTRLQQLGVDITSITQEVINLIVYLTSLIFTAAGIFLWVTYQNEEVKATGSCEPVNCLDYAMSLYFVVVTISTVGYGDILATNAAGRAVVICIIVAALIILPVQLSNISNLLAHRPYGGRFSAASATGMRFVVLTGQLSLLSIQQFLAELYHPLHDKALSCARSLQSTTVHFELRSLIAEYHGAVRFIQGSPMALYDLHRVQIALASAVFIVLQPFQSSRALDNGQIAQALAMNRYAGPLSRLVVEMGDPQGPTLPVWDSATQRMQVLCHESLRFKVLGSSCFMPGLSTFLTNLLRSPLLLDSPGHKAWLPEYHSGAMHSIYPVLLPAAFYGLPFEEVAEFVYRCFHVCLFALDVLVEPCERHGGTGGREGEGGGSRSYSGGSVGQHTCERCVQVADEEEHGCPAAVSVSVAATAEACLSFESAREGSPLAGRSDASEVFECAQEGSPLAAGSEGSETFESAHGSPFTAEMQAHATQAALAASAAPAAPVAPPAQAAQAAPAAAQAAPVLCTKAAKRAEAAFHTHRNAGGGCSCSSSTGSTDSTSGSSSCSSSTGSNSSSSGSSSPGLLCGKEGQPAVPASHERPPPLAPPPLPPP